MKFDIIFKCRLHNWSPVKIEKQSVGLYVLDRIRDEIYTKGMTIVREMKDIEYESYSLYLTEDEVRSNSILSNMFKNTSIIYVIVPDMFLNQFMDLKIVADNCTIKCEWVMNVENLSKKWIDTGCKIEWQEDTPDSIKTVFRRIKNYFKFKKGNIR